MGETNESVFPGATLTYERLNYVITDFRTFQKDKPSNSGLRKQKVDIPRRKPSIVIPARVPLYITADKTTCAECGCFPNEDPYVRNKKLKPCLKRPFTLYELAAAAVDGLPLPEAVAWSVDDVADWIAEKVALPQYRECILMNEINGLRLLRLEDPSSFPTMGIHNFQHIQMITSKVREAFGAEFIKFSRSIALPPRKPLTHCTWFNTKTGPTWGIRRNWSRCDVLRWMKIIMPEPLHLDHWDLVWYHKPDFPKVKFAKISISKPKTCLPHYIQSKEKFIEYLVPRKFRLLTGLSESQQMIWMEKRIIKEAKLKAKAQHSKIHEAEPQKIIADLRGKDFILARRKMPRPKFLP